MSNQHLGTNNFGNCKWIVNSNKALGTHTTISSAISSASSGDDIFIMPGTYTENPTISKNVNLVAFDCDSQNQTVEINGQITISSGVTTCISNIYLYGPASPMITDSSGSGITAYFINCNIYYGGAALATVMSFSTATSSSYYFKNCLMSAVGSNNFVFIETSTTGNYIEMDQCIMINNASNGYVFDITNFSIKNSLIYGYIVTNDSSSSTSTIEYSVINLSAASAASTPSLKIISNASNTLVINSYKNTYIVGNSTASCVGFDNASTGTATFNSYGDSFITGNATAVTVLAGGSGTSNFNYADMSTNASTPYTVGASLTVTPYTSAGFYLGNQYSNTKTSCLGEQIRSYIASASAVTLTTATSLNVTSISLTAGIWNVSAICAFNGTVTGTQSIASISSTTNTLSGNTGDSQVETGDVSLATSDLMLTIPGFRVALSSTTIYYLVAQATFTVGTQKAYGRISAVRVG